MADEARRLPPPARIELLGAPRLLCAEQAPRPLERHDAALLALLALDGPTPRSRIAALLWPDSDATQAANSLRQRLFRLKRVAGRDLVGGQRVLALAPGVSSDLAEDRAGELLAGFDDFDDGELAGWLATARERLRGSRRERLADTASRLEAEGRIAEALEVAEQLVLDDPTAEHAHRRVMRLHYLRGDRAAALAAYRRCADTLQRELHARPGEETLQLAATIERSGALERAAPVQRPLPTTLRRPPRLVGREADWCRLDEALAAGAAVLVEGEPGIGKSRLLTDYAAARGWPAPVGARPGDEAMPHALLARWLDALCERFGPPADAAVGAELARLLPRLGEGPAAPDGLLEPARLLLAVEAALKHWPGAAGMVLDDLQFADAASLELLLSLAAAGSGRAWVLAFRAQAEPAPVRRWREGSEPGRVVHLRLALLDAAALAALLESLELPGLDPRAWAPALAAHCGGHPFFVIDTLAALHAEGRQDFAGEPRLPAAPAGQLSAIAQRLDQLPPAAQQLAQVAAAAGQDFGVELAAAVLGCAPVALALPWRLLEQAGLFRSGGFAHDLVRQAALDALPAAIERALHGQIAAWLAARDDGGRAARVAAHLEAAGDPAGAAQHYERLAGEAHRRSARREELQALDAAARCHRQAGRPGSAAAAFDCDWRGVRLLLSLDSADAALARAETLLATAGDEHQRAAALEARAYVRAERFEPEAALDDARAAVELARGCGARRVELLAAQRAAAALMRLARPAEAVAAQEARRDALGSLDDEERLIWLSDHATALDYADRRREAVRMFDQVIEQAEPRARWSAASEAWGNKAIALMYLNRPVDSLEASLRAIDCGRRAGTDRGSLLIDEMTVLGSLRDLGRYAEYLEPAERLPQALREVGYPVWAFNAENDLAVAYLWLGRPELARRALTPIPDDQAPMMRASRLFTQARLARWGATATGQPSAAELVKRAHALIEAAGGTGRSYVRLRVQLELARDEPADAAIERVVAIEAEAIEREQLMLALHALVLRTELLLRVGAADRAADAGEELLAHCQAGGAPPGLYAPEVWWTAARAVRARSPQRAAQALAEAQRWIERIALPRMPEVFRASFVERNPVNAAILAAARAPGA